MEGKEKTSWRVCSSSPHLFADRPLVFPVLEAAAGQRVHALSLAELHVLHLFVQEALEGQLLVFVVYRKSRLHLERREGKKTEHGQLRTLSNEVSPDRWAVNVSLFCVGFLPRTEDRGFHRLEEVQTVFLTAPVDRREMGSFKITLLTSTH